MYTISCAVLDNLNRRRVYRLQLILLNEVCSLPCIRFWPEGSKFYTRKWTHDSKQWVGADILGSCLNRSRRCILVYLSFIGSKILLCYMYNILTCVGLSVLAICCRIVRIRTWHLSVTLSCLIWTMAYGSSRRCRSSQPLPITMFRSEYDARRSIRSPSLFV